MNIRVRRLLGKAKTQFHCHICGGIAVTGRAQYYYSNPEKEALYLKCGQEHEWSIMVTCSTCWKVPEYGIISLLPVLKCCFGFSYPNGRPSSFPNPFLYEIEI